MTPHSSLHPEAQHDHEQPILDVHNLSVHYTGHTALQNITFHLHIGERVAVVGPNGAGKSTLFKVIAGVQPPSGGAVSIFGSQPSGHACIGYVPQRSQVDWRFPVSVEDVVMMGRVARMGLFGLPRQADRERVRAALETVRLLPMAQRQIAQLSGGQQQRMFIARALAQEAELMLMDEPLTGLDSPSQEGLLELLDTLQQQRVTLLVATHDLQQAAEHFDKILLLNRRLIAFGQPAYALAPEKLTLAYGSSLQTVDTSCCGEEHLHA